MFVALTFDRRVTTTTVSPQSRIIWLVERTELSIYVEITGVLLIPKMWYKLVSFGPSHMFAVLINNSGCVFWVTVQPLVWMKKTCVKKCVSPLLCWLWKWNHLELLLVLLCPSLIGCCPVSSPPKDFVEQRSRRRGVYSLCWDAGTVQRRAHVPQRRQQQRARWADHTWLTGARETYKCCWFL